MIWLYAIMRGMRETVGFELGEFAYLSALALAPALTLLAAATVLAWTIKVPRATLYAIAGSIIAASLLGIGLSEIVILLDERAFAREAAAAEQQGHLHYARDRAWPNAACSLVWNVGSGIHATD
jgi:hypothetical protein